MVSKRLCENRSNPVSACQGKCYLKKQLGKAGNLESRSGKLADDNKLDIQVFILPTPICLSADLFITVKQHDNSYLQGRLVKVSHSIFHPPKMPASFRQYL